MLAKEYHEPWMTEEDCAEFDLLFEQECGDKIGSIFESAERDGVSREQTFAIARAIFQLMADEAKVGDERSH